MTIHKNFPLGIAYGGYLIHEDGFDSNIGLDEFSTFSFDYSHDSVQRL